MADFDRRSQREFTLRDSVMDRISEAALFPRPVWSSRRTYIIASIAGVVGLGNIWRFPYIAGENGGGTFLAAYAICLPLIALPLAIVESSAGNLAQRSPVGLFRRLHPRWGPLVGWLPIAVTVAIMSYYFVVTGWTLGYTGDALGDDLKTFATFTDGLASLWLFLVVGLLVGLFLLGGMSRLETASRFLLPILVILLGGLAIYAQTLGGAGDALDFYTRFDFGRFLDLQTWQMAAGQSFYSLGVGQGILIAYGSYGPAGTNLVQSTTAVAGTNAFVSLIAGLLILPIAFTFGIPPDTGSELSFTAFPRLLDDLAGGRFIGIAFFALLFVAGFTSCLGGAVVVRAAVADEFRLSAGRATLLVVGLIVLLGLPSALSFTSVGLTVFDRPFLDVMDRVTGSGLMVASALFGAALIAWRLPRGRLRAAMNADPFRVGPLTFSPGHVIQLARWVPLALLAWMLATTVL